MRTKEKKEAKETKETNLMVRKGILFLVLIILTLIYTYYIRITVDDEFFNYGFAINILNGLIPYKDFNMIVPPLFHYLLAFFIKILGQQLIVYHFVLSLLLSGITILAYNKIGKSAFTIHLLLLIYPYTGYNIFCIFLLFILLTRKEDKYSKYIDPILIIMMILSKQTLVLLAIPNLIYAKNRKKTFLIYLISALFFFVYLLIHNNLIEFIDYCFLGMFDFTSKNNTGINPMLILEIGILIVLGYYYKKEKDKNILYVLMFQIMAFPIVNYYHFVISFAPVLYILFQKTTKYKLVSHFALTIFISYFVVFNVSLFSKEDAYQYISKYPVDNFMKDRATYTLTSLYVKESQRILDTYPERSAYFFGYFSYLIKLNNDIPINKFDIINDGNMGYGGSKKYIEEIEENCQKNKCIFFVSERETTSEVNVQTNQEILKYVMENYSKNYSSAVFSVYIN